MSDLTPPPQFGFGVIPPTSVGPRVSPEDWRLIENKIQEKATKMTDDVEITEGVGDELILTGGKFSPRPRLVIGEDAAALREHFTAEQPAPLSDNDRGAAAWAVNHLIDKHGYSSIVSRDGSRVSLNDLLTKLGYPRQDEDEE